MSQYQSTNSLQNSVISWTFGKKRRFSDIKFKNDNLYNVETKKVGDTQPLDMEINMI